MENGIPLLRIVCIAFIFLERITSEYYDENESCCMSFLEDDYLTNQISQWLEKKHLYHVEARPPSLFSDNLRTDCKTFLEVHKLARSRKDADFWFAMAVAERERKGKLGRTPGLVYPAKRPAQPDSMVPNKDARESPKGPEQSPKTEGLGNISAKKMPGVDDEQLNSDMESSDMGTPPKTPNQARSNNMEPEGPPAASDVGSSPETISRKTMPKGFYVYISVGTQTDLESISRSVSYPSILSHNLI